MEIEKLSGLPAHPLVVHAAVVLLPLAAVAATVVDVGHSGAKATWDDVGVDDGG